MNGAVVGSYGGITANPSTLIPASSSGGTAYFVTATGVNDITNGVSLSTYLANMQGAWSLIHGYASNVKVIATTIQSGSASGSNYGTTDALSPWNQAILTQVTGTTTAPDAVADVAAIFNDFISQQALGIYYDNLHLTSAGYQIYAHVIANEILNPGSKPTPLSPALFGGICRLPRWRRRIRSLPMPRARSMRAW